MQISGEIDKDLGLKNEIRKPPFKQTCIVATILITSFLSEASDTLEIKTYTEIFISAVLFCLLVILTEYKGRKVLFITLNSLSILSSMMLLTIMLPIDLLEFGDVLQTSIRGATVALTAVVLCEYVEPRHRLTQLIVNSAILRVSYWIIFSCADQITEFDVFIQFVKIGLGLVCLGSVLTWPESPYWLASKGRFEEAKKAFSLVRSADPKSTELETLIDSQRPCGSAKMIYVPLLIGLPVILVYSTIIYYFENAFYIGITSMKLEEMWIYLALNVVITGVCILIARKVSRRVLILLPTATSTVTVIFIILWENYLHYHVSWYMNLSINSFSYLVLYPITLCAITAFNYPIAIESIACRYSNLLSGIFGIVYFISLPLCKEVLDMSIVVALIILCLLVNPIIAYFLLPEGKDKTLIEIEQAYRPKIQREQADV